MQSKIDISVIICCYNSENRIIPTLEHLSKQIRGPLHCEIILVDNNCTDNTVETAKAFWVDCGNPFELNVIEEFTSGISYARKKGAYSAKGEIIVFCDDDNWLEQNYLSCGYNIIYFNPEIGVLGGRGMPVFETEKPAWFSSFQSSYAVGFQSIYSGDVSSRGYVWGAGCFIRRQTMIQLYESGFESFCTGRKGGLLLSGDDSEICKWHLLIGKKLWYDESLVFKHFIENHRLQKEYLSRLIDGFNIAGEYLSLYDEVLFYQKSSQIIKVKIQIKRLKNLLFDYKNFSLKYFKLKKIKKASLNYFKSLA
jgi:glycosyltransferase involved in cell wall biosynthesis